MAQGVGGGWTPHLNNLVGGEIDRYQLLAAPQTPGEDCDLVAGSGVCGEVLKRFKRQVQGGQLVVACSGAGVGWGVRGSEWCTRHRLVSNPRDSESYTRYFSLSAPPHPHTHHSRRVTAAASQPPRSSRPSECVY